MLRPAEERDVEAMRAWRNQDANREVSINSHVIGAAEHRAWWERVRSDRTRRVLVFEYDGRPLGVVNFFDIDIDIDAGSAHWGFFLDNETTTAEGTAMLAWMAVMREATDYAFTELGVDVLRGEVLADNEAVRVMNRRFRFTEGDPEAREADGRTITVIPISLRREDRRRR
ncbi:GNAT family N-acetyltransferase [Actinophytocola gossypii]|uniref:GNAT family N-acetyltransferase n=1 Tax=Actinophytocola gossypii TaxID=2812003 RepID=A0ABT2JH39_9PSEU|nr:GNAT family N-acetyltransferase [Actinophytocola gossypii]MCT2587188.1 GNAT family N-acetyltransferase [Actinophytocola gossypii]